MINWKRALCAGLSCVLLATVLPIVLPALAADENLSLGKSYTLTYESPIEHAFPAREYKPEQALTDGKKAASAIHSDPAFLHLYRGTSVCVTVDLESECAVSSVELRSLQLKGAGIECPRYIRVAVSTDGENFGTVGVLEDSKSVTLAATQIITQSVALDQAYRARYVRVIFSSDVYVYTDELTVFGNSDASGSAVATADEPETERGFAKPIDGIGNIVLMYTIGHYSEAELLPYFAYVESGRVKDTMFDAMLFLPSGASSFDYTVPAGWDAYCEELFGQSNHTNLTALNALVGSHSKELGLGDEYRYPVFLSVPYLDTGTNLFDGIAPDSLEHRSAILATFVDRLISTFEDAEYAHLELKGFYWHEELIPYTKTEYEEELILQFNQYVHEKGYKSIWIPYYCAPGFERAADLGFDAATLQSGYAFARTGAALSEIGEVLPEAVSDSAAKAQKFGLGMEFEMDLGRNDCAARFYQYLYTGYRTGCMENGIMMLYQSVKGIYGCAQAGVTSEQRRIYDLLYLYTKNQFSSVAPVIEQGQVIVAPVDARVSGSLIVTDPDSLKGELNVNILEAPSTFSFLMEGDGFYLLNTKGAEAGLYTLRITISDGHNSSEEATIPILLLGEANLFTIRADQNLTVYSRLTQDSETVEVPAGTELSVASVADGWTYVSGKLGDEKISGFVQGLSVPDASVSSDSQLQDSSVPSDSGPALWVWILSVVAVIAVVALLGFLIWLKKRK